MAMNNAGSIPSTQMDIVHSDGCPAVDARLLILDPKIWTELDEMTDLEEIKRTLLRYKILKHPAEYTQFYPFMRKIILKGRRDVLEFMKSQNEMIEYQANLTEELWAQLKK